MQSDGLRGGRLRCRLRVRQERGASPLVAADLSNPRRVVARDESGPRYLSQYNQRALLREGFLLLEGVGDGLGDGGRDLDAPGAKDWAKDTRVEALFDDFSQS